MRTEADLYDTIVKVMNGPFKGRIGYVDDHDEGNKWIVCFGHPLSLPQYAPIPKKSLKKATANDLIKRFASMPSVVRFTDDPEAQVDLLQERLLIQDEIWSLERSLFYQSGTDGGRVFISHSSKDKPFVRQLCLDLAEKGITPWLDELQISVGQSIPKEISAALAVSQFVIVVLSPSSVGSAWVEREWHDSLWNEVESRHIRLLPILFKKCEIPPLLRGKKYADFTHSYESGFESLVSSIHTHNRKKTRLR